MVEQVEPEPLALAAAGARACTRCPELVAARTQVVWGGGGADADVLVVADAPGAREDALGAPLTGAARRLLDDALAAAGLGPDAVWVTGLLKCRPPGNREPRPGEVAGCQHHLVAVVEAVRPVVVVALGEAVTKALRGRSGSIRERRGCEEPQRLGEVAVWLLPVFHPAAAAYAPALAERLRADLARVPELVARGRPVVEPEPEPAGTPELPPDVAGPGQLGLF